MSGQVVGYIRVSSVDQNPDRQVAALGEVDETFTDKVSGKNRADRPALAELLRHVRRDDTVRITSMDRLARSVVDLAQLVQDMTTRGARVEFVTERLTFGPGAEDPFAADTRPASRSHPGWGWCAHRPPRGTPPSRPGSPPSRRPAS